MTRTVEEKVSTLMGNLMRNLKRGSEAWAWAMDLAGVLNQTNPCDKCGGTGIRRKHENCNHNCEDAWIRGCNEPVLCRKCRGCTRIPK